MSETAIAIPTSRKLQRLLVRGLPVVFFGIVCAASALLWQFENHSVVLRGEVEAIEHLVSSPQAGLVSQLVPSDGAELDLFTYVEKDQILIELDDTELRNRLDTIQTNLLGVAEEINTELEQLRQPKRESSHDSVPVSLNAEIEDTESTDTDEDDPASDIWEATYAIVGESQNALAAVRGELDLRQLDILATRAKSEVIAKRIDSSEVEEVQAKRAEASQKLFDMRRDIAPDRSANLNEIPSDELDGSARLLFRSVSHRISAAEAELAAVAQAIDGLSVVSPVTGQIEKNLVSPNEAVTAGQPLLSIVPTRGSHVVVYVRERSAIRPYAGMEVALRQLENPSQAVDAIVEAVGPRVVEVPERLRSNPSIMEWGRPMRIKAPQDWPIEPGSLMDVVIKSN